MDPGTAFLIASTAMKAFGAISQGKAQRKQANFQAGMSDFEAAVLRQQAERERQVAAAGEDDFRRAQRRFLGQRRAELGASGVDISTGTPLIAIGDFAAETELQAMRIREGGEASATRLEQQAGLSNLQARMNRLAGKSAAKRGLFKAGSSLLSAGSTFFDK